MVSDIKHGSLAFNKGDVCADYILPNASDEHPIMPLSVLIIILVMLVVVILALIFSFAAATPAISGRPIGWRMRTVAIILPDFPRRGISVDITPVVGSWGDNKDYLAGTSLAVALDPYYIANLHCY